ncbi:MAG: hypothetical protein WCS28_03000 [Thiomicrospira sp.]|jgi:hypothetical protein
MLAKGLVVGVLGVGLGGCQAINPDTILAAGAISATTCWMNECELFYPTKVNVPAYYDVGMIDKRYEPQRDYYMDELACMNNSARCDGTQTPPQLFYQRHVKPYINK